MISHKMQLEFTLILLTGGLILFFFVLKPFLTTLVLATMFAVILYPLYRRILKRVGNREAIASLITVLLSVVCILIPLTFLGTQVFHESVQLYGSLTQEDNKQNTVVALINSAGQTFENFLPGTRSSFTSLSNNIDIYIKQGLEWFINHLGVAISSASTLLLDLFIFFISFYYLLIDGSRLKQIIIKLSPLDDEEDEIIFKRLGSAVNSVIKGNLMIAFLQGILATIGFTIFGVPNSILWGTVTIITALVPYFGSSLVIIPGIIYLFIIGSSLPAIGLMLWGIFVVGLIDNILGPKLIGHELQLHPLFVLLSVLGGIALFGPIGIFIGPLTMSLLFAFISIYLHLTNSATRK